MHPKKEMNANVGVGIGYLLQLAGGYVALTIGGAAIIGLALIVISLPVFVWGCMNYAEGKHHSKWVGLVSFAGLIGLIVLILLPDRSPDGSVDGLQRRNLIGVICLLSGLALAVLGRALDDLGKDVRVEEMLRPWPGICMFVGVCLAVGSLVLMLNDSRQ